MTTSSYRLPAVLQKLNPGGIFGPRGAGPVSLGNAEPENRIAFTLWPGQYGPARLHQQTQLAQALSHQAVRIHGAREVGRISGSVSWRRHR